MPRKYIRKTNRPYVNKKTPTVPTAFKPGFLSTLDRRTEVAKQLTANKETIINDIGGELEMSHIKSALVERFVWMEALCQSLEDQMAKGEISIGEHLAKWVQAVNGLSGLAKTLGIERKLSTRPWLASASKDDAQSDAGTNGSSDE